jgi:hypothetical protein
MTSMWSAGDSPQLLGPLPIKSALCYSVRNEVDSMTPLRGAINMLKIVLYSPGVCMWTP